MGELHYNWTEVYKKLEKLHIEGDFNFNNVKNSDKLPSISAITDTFGGIKELRRMFNGEERPQIPPVFCRECAEEPDTCGKKPEECYEQASLWRKLRGQSFTVEWTKKSDSHKYI